MARRKSVLLSVAAVLALTGSTGASSATGAGNTSADAIAIQVSAPGLGGSTGAGVSGPPDKVGGGGSFAYPADGSIARAGVVSSAVSGENGAKTTATASARVSALSLFGGEITVASISARATASAGARSASGSISGSRVSGLSVLGQAVSTAPGTSVAYGQWGTVSVLDQSASPFGTAGIRGFRAGVTALHIHLHADHAGAPAGTDIVVGFADVTAEMVRVARPAVSQARGAKPLKPKQATRKRKQATKKETQRGRSLPPIRRIPFDVFPKLTAGRYVFPIYGPASYTNTFGAPRAAPVVWHHGEDIFAPLGAPVLAVADGIVYSVGWNDLGGLRFWLRDRAGNEFYYAHLSAFSPLAVDGAQVRAGDVLGFVGNTGDAEGTPYHLHFEIHPVSLLYQLYDGAVAPYPYLNAWKRLIDLPFTAVAGWAPPLADSSRAPKPGAILLQARDISSASGLDPDSLRRALRATGPLNADGSVSGLVAGARENIQALARSAAAAVRP